MNLPAPGLKASAVSAAASGYTAHMNEEHLESMQTKIAFLERAVHELSDVVFRQDKEIQRMEARLQAVCGQLTDASSDGNPRAPEEEIPPHY